LPEILHQSILLFRCVSFPHSSSFLQLLPSEITSPFVNHKMAEKWPPEGRRCAGPLIQETSATMAYHYQSRKARFYANYHDIKNFASKRDEVGNERCNIRQTPLFWRSPGAVREWDPEVKAWAYEIYLELGNREMHTAELLRETLLQRGHVE
jgi:hypothetical protein